MKPQPDPIESLRDLFLESAASIFEELSLDAKRRLADGGKWSLSVRAKVDGRKVVISGSVSGSPRKASDYSDLLDDPNQPLLPMEDKE